MAEVNIRKMNFNRLTALLQQIDNHSSSPLDYVGVNTISDRAKLAMDKCEQAHEVLVRLCKGEPELIVQESAFGPIEATYQELQTKIKRLLLTLPNPSTCGSSGSTATTNSSVKVKLPEFKPPTFDGTFSDWLSFKDLFIAAVGSNKAIPDSQKLSYLKSSLQGEPATLIKNLQTLDSNYAEAWKILDERYNNQREIVHGLVNNLLSVTAMKTENAVQLQQLVDKTVECVRALKSLKRPTDTWDDLLVVLTVNKLDSATRREWAIRQTGTNLPSFQDLLAFLTSHIRGLIATGSVTLTAPSKPQREKFVKVHHVTAEQALCVICNGNHHHYKCNEFLSKTESQRSEIARKYRLCFNCLGKNHHIKDCPIKGSCKKCGKRHHTLLHVDQPRPPTPTAAAIGRSNESQPTNSVGSHHVEMDTRGLCKTAVVHVQTTWGKLLPCRIMIDGGSQGEFISERLASRLGLKRESSSVKVTGFGGVEVGGVMGKVQLTLLSTTGNHQLNADLYVMKKLTRTLPSVTCKTESWEHLEGITLADPKWYVPGGIDILIGTRYFPEVMLSGRRDGPKNTPTAFETIFGWVLCGVSAEENVNTIPSYHVEVDPLHELVKTFWDAEHVPEEQILTEEEAAVEEHYQNTYTRDDSGRFTVAIPFNNKKQLLGASRAAAVKRFLQVERRLQRQPQYREQYVSFMREYENLGHMRKLSPEEAPEVEGSTYYLPHHFVVNEESTTTKLRVVFDGSAPTTSGVSLNDTMMVGATIQDDLYDHLLRFRLNPVILKADIAKMFRQFRLNNSDAQFHRILWREDPSQPLQDYVLETVTYGTACATFLSTRSIQQTGKDCAVKYPLASQALLKSMYVDDLLATAKSSKEAISLYRELDRATTEAGMELRKWSSNDPSVLAAIPEAHREADPHSFGENDSIKALGIRWHPNGDYFKFKKVEQLEISATKRSILSELCRVFDPLGLLSCVILRAKLLLQELWKCGVGWDEPVPDYIQQQWNEYTEDLKSIDQIRIPRQVMEPNCVNYELHAFADSSELAWGCVLYLRCIMPDGGAKVKMITSKTHVAPTKQVTLPRLELNAAVSAAKLCRKVVKVLNLDCTIFCYSDSTIVLRWISSSPRRWKTYIANRVAIIQRLTPIECWRHVPGIENPADLASRGASIEDLRTNQFWWQGPSWLVSTNLPLYIMPATPPDADMEEKSSPLLVNSVELDMDILERFSGFTNMQRVTAYMLRYMKHLQGEKKIVGPLTALEHQEALMLWVRKTQQQFFGKEIALLQARKQINSNSKLKSLHPFLDSSGILRLSGRISKSNLSAANKHQIILPAACHLSELIMDHYHRATMHGGFQLTWSSILSRYWMLGGRDKTRHFVRRCVTCRRQRASTAEQLMGELPAQRVTPARPFLHTGVDYAGPFTLKNPVGVAPKQYKGYLCVFVCMSTKAVHLEAVSSLSSDAFLEALWRFTSRRGLCAHIYSDCGTNFVGADKELRNFTETEDFNNNMAENLASKTIQWHFNVPSAPHHGGLWEAAVKSAKHHLRRVIGNSPMTYEFFSTILCRIEAVLNSRPLYAMSSDPSDLSVLTPGHFLVGEPLNAIPEPCLEDVPQNRLTKFQLQQQRVQHFWRRWSKEYLNTLQQRNKWRWQKEEVQVGDLVLLVEDTPPSTWRMGRILDTHAGTDGHIRSVTLKTATSTLQRPIVKLVPLINDK